jgi:transposase
MDAPAFNGISCAKVEVSKQPPNSAGASGMNITTIGIDLAKNLFQVHGVNERGKPQLRKQLKRAQMLRFFVNLPPCLIGMEAYGSSHFWARNYRSWVTL